MSQEYQRIATELLLLQQEILRNELPALISSLSPHANTHQYFELLLTGLTNIQRGQFLNAIAKNISAIKSENSHLKSENQSYKVLIENHAAQSKQIQTLITQLTYQKNSLQLELEDLRARQGSLAQLLNSSTLELRIKETLRENELMRGLLEQRERLAEVRSLEIEALRNKERETEDEMRELGERRKLLERELAEATNHILELRDTHYQLADNQNKLKQHFAQTTQSQNVLIEELKDHLRKEIAEKNIEILSKVQAVKQNQQIAQERQKQSQRAITLQQENNCLRDQLSNMKTQQQLSKTALQAIEAKEKELSQVISALTTKINMMVESNQNTLNTMTLQRERKEELLTTEINRLTEEITNAYYKCSKIDASSALHHQTQNQSNSEKRYCRIEETENKTNSVKKPQEPTVNESDHQTTKMQTKLQSFMNQASQQRQDQQQEDCITQNTRLKLQLQELLSRNCEHSQPRPNKLIFHLLLLKQQVSQVQAEQLRLRQSSATALESSRRWILKQATKLVQHLLEHKVECGSCQHSLKYQCNKKTGGRSKVTTDGKTGKDLKSLNQRSKLIKEQNQIIGSRILEIIHN